VCWKSFGYGINMKIVRSLSLSALLHNIIFLFIASKEEKVARWLHVAEVFPRWSVSICIWEETSAIQARHAVLFVVCVLVCWYISLCVSVLVYLSVC